MGKKHIILTKLFEFGGSNEHLKTLIKYLGSDNVVLLLETKEQLAYLKNIASADGVTVKIISNIHPHAHLQYKFTTNIKELFHIVRSLITLQLLSIYYGFADITICAVEPEKHLYFLWVPFIKVYYILHTTPNKKYTSFTSFTCNTLLGNRKKIITVSIANKNAICTNWEISEQKSRYVTVVYNCLSSDEIKTPEVNHEARKHIITTLGQVIEYKNPEVWLEVAKVVTTMREDVTFEWLGNGPLLDYYRSATVAEERINFRGLITQPQNYLKQAFIYYQPSKFETHGIAVVEAMSCSLPCVASNTGGLPESVSHQYNGLLVEVTNISDHVNAILGLIDNSVLREEYGKNSYSRYLNLFSYDNFKTGMDKVYA